MPSHPSHPPRQGPDALASSFAASYAGVVAFIAVVTEGSFARAGDRLGIGRSAVSRSVQKLEEQLDARLFFRTTRSTTLTREGELFYENCNPGVERIVQALEEMRELREGPPQGRLRVASTVGFGRKVVAPLLRGFQLKYPEVAIDLLLDDAATEFTAGHVDVAFRNGRLEDSQIVARQLFPMQLLVCASPAYRSTHGLPRSVEELADHRCINLRHASGRVCEWEFKVGGRPRKFSPEARTSFNDAELVLQAVLDGQGLAQLPGYQIFDLVQSGALVPCLAQYAPDDRGHYICYLSRRHLPSRVRVFIDYMTTHTRTLNVQSLTTFSAAPR
ncbi:LysR family transcriptional regulator [Nannocystis sp. ILAH1]|uniref:LysR family transcriptional regulator n=1 Tax=unclassified Nannocystis TaxID=2627009 RepID=UPI002270A1F2|nr:LysR family transcriptional regulator [Nannocystis sp. ILAH1]MCY1070186.1 LysR family transcriptional regulator [Nannocystis sp. RBIL2]